MLQWTPFVSIWLHSCAFDSWAAPTSPFVPCHYKSKTGSPDARLEPHRESADRKNKPDCGRTYQLGGRTVGWELPYLLPTQSLVVGRCRVGCASSFSPPLLSQQLHHTARRHGKPRHTERMLLRKMNTVTNSGVPRSLRE